MAIDCEEPASCLAAGELAADLLGLILDGDSLEGRQSALEEYLVFACPRAVDPNSRLLMGAARARGLPARWLDQEPFAEAPEGRVIRFGLLQMGYGARSRLFSGPMPKMPDLQVLAGITDRASVVSRLMEAGVPVPAQDLDFPNKNSAARAVRGAERLGYPVTVQYQLREEFSYRHPKRRMFGPLASREQVLAVFEAAAGPARKIWVERYCSGMRCRFLVIAGRVRSVVLHEPPVIVGDGVTTVDQLIARQANADHTGVVRSAWKKMASGDLDVDLRLSLAGLGRDSVPASGYRINLRAEGTYYNGGLCRDVTELTGEALKGLAERAVGCFSLNELAGVDMAVSELTGPAEAPNAVVLDVLPDPDLEIHTHPHLGPGCDVGRQLVDAILPREASARIPLVAVTGTNGKTTTSRMIGHILRQSFRYVGMATTTGALVNDEQLRDGDVAGVTGAALVLADARTEVAVLETARGGLIKLGAGFDSCDVGVFLNVASDHLGLDGVYTLDQMAAVKGDVIRRTTGTVVLNADDHRVLATGAGRPPGSVILVSRHTDNPTVTAHRAAGGRVVVTEGSGEDAQILACHGGTRAFSMPANHVAATLGGRVAFNVDNAMFAVAAAWALGVPNDAIRVGLERFQASYEFNPARFNVDDTLSFRVVIDYAHNADGMRVLCGALRALSRPKRRIMLLTTSRSRSDEEIREFARAAAAEHFDRYVCCVRGQSTGVPELLRDTLLEEGIPEDGISTLHDMEQAVTEALDCACPGDLVVLLGGKTAPMMRRKIQERAAEATSVPV